MIRHAWSVLCDKHIIDQATNNISLDSVEQIEGILSVPATAPQGKIQVPSTLRLVSLWYRKEALGETGSAQISIESPSGENLGHADLQVDLQATTRQRTILMLPVIPYDSPGLYEYVIKLREGDGLREVARVPFEANLQIIRSEEVT